MQDYQALIAAPRFRAFWFALLCNNLASWCVIAAIPILVAERFGAGMVLVLSLGLRTLPKVILAPVAAGLLRDLPGARQHRLMAAMDAVEIADGVDAAPQRRRRRDRIEGNNERRMQ